MELNHDTCYRAHQTRDARFDGRFFTGVTSTGIFCRPTCPSTTPKPEHCRFFSCAAAAQQAGFRPCLRCRPELAPDIVASFEPRAVVSRALDLVAEGALDEGSVADLAARVGVVDRHLRRLFDQHLGTTPVVVAQTRRLLFAKQLLDETSLSVTDVAMAAGFGSVRRFNEVVQHVYGRTPRDLRHSRVETPPGDPAPDVVLRLPFSPPYDWDRLARFLMPRAIPGVESVTLDRYQRTIALDGQRGYVSVRPVAGQPHLEATIRHPAVGALGRIVERLRRLFDLGANPEGISAHLSANPLLAPLVASAPGLRVPGAWDGFELAVRAVLGQQVSVAAATTLAGRLAEARGEPFTADPPPWAHPSLRLIFPSAERLASADPAAIGLTRARTAALSALAAAVTADPDLVRRCRDLDEHVAALCRLQGVGVWTAQYIAMRAGHEPDAFPSTDLGIRRALGALLGLPGPAPAEQAQSLAENWRPWRAYAAMYLWTGVQT
jgi:AraC family transcriptional regulator of adaptative response / DNA-3-methyladenine glycosylase II